MIKFALKRTFTKTVVWLQAQPICAQAQGENNMAKEGIGGPKTKPAIPQDIEGIGGPKIEGSNNGVKSISFNGQTTSQQTVKVINPNNQTLTWGTTVKYNAGEPGGWLQLSPHTGKLNAGATSNPPVKVNVDKTKLTQGKTYTAQVPFSWQGHSSHGDTLEVTVTV
jgi:hypothetical protein